MPPPNNLNACRGPILFIGYRQIIVGYGGAMAELVVGGAEGRPIVRKDSSSLRNISGSLFGNCLGACAFTCT